MKIGIIDYGAGNLKSVKNSLSFLNKESFLIKNIEDFEKADKIILPGVGAGKIAMEKMHKLGFDNLIKNTKKPILGICLGLQLFTKFSEEGNVDCLNIFENQVKKIPNFVKVPQIGWNKVFFSKSNFLFDEIKNGSYFYFVHSYYCENLEKNTLATTNYGIEFSSVIQKNNFYATQFHPEKSGKNGLKLLNNFCIKCE
jgi:glutamine amidotransferase